MALKQVIIVALLIGACLAQDDSESEGRRRFFPRNRFTSTTESAPRRDAFVEDNKDELVERRRLLLSRNRSRGLPGSSSRRDEAEQASEDASPVEEAPALPNKRFRIKAAQNEVTIEEKPTTAPISLDIPVEKITNPEIQKALLDEEDDSKPFDGLTIVTRVSSSTGIRSSNEQIQRVSFKRPTPTTTEPETIAAEEEPEVNEVQDRPRAGVLRRRFRPGRKQVGSENETEENTEDSEVPGQRKEFLKRIRGRGFRRPKTTTPAPAPITTAFFVPEDTTTPAPILPVVTEGVPELPETTVPLVLANRPKADASAALEALLRTASSPVTEAPAETTQAAVEEEPEPHHRRILADMKKLAEDTRKALPRRLPGRNRDSQEPRRVPVRGRRPSQRRPAQPVNEDDEQPEQNSPITEFNSFPSRESSNPRFLAREQSIIGRSRGDSGHRQPTVRVQPQQPAFERPRSQAEELEPVVEAVDEAEVEEKALMSHKLEVPEEVRPMDDQKELLTARPPQLFTTFSSTPQLDATNTDFNLPSFSTLSATTASLTPFVARPTPPAPSPAPARNLPTLPPRATPTQATFQPAAGQAEQPAQPTRLAVGNPATLLQSNRFAEFDAQFGGAVPVRTIPQTQTRVNPAPAAQPVNNRPQAFTAFTAFNTNRAQPASPQQTSFQPIRTVAATNTLPAQPIRTVASSNQLPAQPINAANASPAQPIRSFSTGVQPFNTFPGAFQQPQQQRPQPFTAFSTNFNNVASQNRGPVVQPQPAAPTFSVSSQPVAAPQPAASSQQTFLNLPPGTFQGHPANDININTGTFTLSTGV